MTDVAVIASQTQAAPLDYTIPGAQELLPKSVSANMDGSGAAAPWFPALQFLDPAGHVMVTAIASSAVAAGASADVSWFPRVGAGGGGGSGPAVLFEQTLTATTASFTTGAGGVAQTHKDLLLVATLRTSEAIESTFDCQVNINGDFAGTYKDGRIKMVNTTITGQIDSPGGWMCMSAAANTADAAIFSPNVLYIPNYTANGDKFALSLQGVNSKAGSSTNWNLGIGSHSYVVNAPITRLDVSPNVGGGGQFVSGSRLIIYGLG